MIFHPGRLVLPIWGNRWGSVRREGSLCRAALINQSEESAILDKCWCNYWTASATLANNWTHVALDMCSQTGHGKFRQWNKLRKWQILKGHISLDMHDIGDTLRLLEQDYNKRQYKKRQAQARHEKRDRTSQDKKIQDKTRPLKPKSMTQDTTRQDKIQQEKTSPSLWHKTQQEKTKQA